MPSMPIVTGVTVIPPYTLEVSFDDGRLRRIDAEPLLFGPVFEPLHDVLGFAEVTVDPEWGTVV